MPNTVASPDEQTRQLLHEAYCATFNLRQATPATTLRTMFTLQAMLVAASKSLDNMASTTVSANQVPAELKTLKPANDSAR